MSECVERPYPAEPSGRPHVIVVGGGVAGLSAAHRLLERGHDVTVLEANAFLGGKLGAHRGVDEQPPVTRTTGERVANEMRFGRRTCGHCVAGGGTAACTADQAGADWPEHCYHMYLNWYHNFYGLMRDIGAMDRFVPMPFINNHRPDPDAPPVVAINPGSPWTALHNLTSGVGSPADSFLHFQAMSDLLAQPATADGRLDQMSVAAFLLERPYTTEDSRSASYRVLAKAFAAPSALASAATYKSFLKYGARLPEPTLWLLDGNTEEAIFRPWLLQLARLSGDFSIAWDRPDFRETFDEAKAINAREQGPGAAGRPSFALKPLHRLAGIEIDRGNGDLLLRIETLETSPSVQPEGEGRSAVVGTEIWRFSGELILAVPPRQLAWLAYNRARDGWAEHGVVLAAADPALAEVTRLKGAPIIALDVYFRRKPATPIPRGIVILLDSRYEMSVFDNAQVWKDGGDNDGLPVLNICASDAETLMPFVGRPGGAEIIVDLMLQELQRYFRFDREADILHCRTHLQTNAGEELFINAVNSWRYRPQTTTAIPNVTIAGDYVQTPVDVVTIEAAAMSGLMAAEAVRRRTGLGRPIPIVLPDSYPVSLMAAGAAMTRPIAYAAKAVSMAESTLRQAYTRLFPRG